jgi:hypothetical protein
MTGARRGVLVDRAQAVTPDREEGGEETCLATSPPPEVGARFALAAARMAETWLRARHVRVSPQDFRIVRDFLERDGWTVEELPGLGVRLRGGGASAEMSREAAALVALRRLVAPSERRRRALRTRVENGGRTLSGRETLALPLDARAQRSPELRIAPRVAEAIRDPREHALAGEEQLGHLAEREA